MADKLHNSLSKLSRPAPLLPLAVTSGSVAIVLAIGLIVALASSVWSFTAIIFVSLVGLGIFTFLVFNHARKLAAEKDARLIDWESALPEIQRENLNLEVAELKKILEVDPEHISDLQSAYIVAEDLALRQIQQEESVPLIRHVSVCKVPFDAVLVKQDVIICAEVSFLVGPDIRQERIDAMMRKIASVKKSIDDMKIGMSARLMMILITQLTHEDGERLRSALNTKRFSSTPVDIEIRMLDFEALQKVYVTD